MNFQNIWQKVLLFRPYEDRESPNVFNIMKGPLIS